MGADRRPVCRNCGTPYKKGATRCWSCPAPARAPFASGFGGGSRLTSAPPRVHQGMGCGRALWFVLVAGGLAITLGVKMVGKTPAFEERDGGVLVPFFLILFVVVIVGLVLVRLFLRGVGAAAGHTARALGASEGTARTIGAVTQVAAGIALARIVADELSDDDGGGAQVATAAMPADLGVEPPLDLPGFEPTPDLAGADLLLTPAVDPLAAPVLPPPLPPPVLHPPEITYPDVDLAGEPPLPQPDLGVSIPHVEPASGLVLEAGTPWPGDPGYVYLCDRTIRDPAGVLLGDVAMIVPPGVHGRGQLDIGRLALEFQQRHGAHAKPGVLRMAVDGTWELLPTPRA